MAAKIESNHGKHSRTRQTTQVVRNIRKITRTMELIATARFKKAMDRAAAANDYTERITQIVRDLAVPVWKSPILCWPIDRKSTPRRC
jgi:F0F1-type ATP synthase gamma subunit